MNTVALVKVTSLEISSGASSHTVTDAFNATFGTYRIVVSNMETSSTSAYVQLTLGSATSNYRYTLNLDNYASLTTRRDNAANYAEIAQGGVGPYVNATFDIGSPYATEYTNWFGFSSDVGNFSWFGGSLVETNSHSSLTLTASTGTISAGTIVVYGYTST